jgi:hypothetical protein
MQRQGGPRRSLVRRLTEQELVMSISRISLIALLVVVPSTVVAQSSGGFGKMGASGGSKDADRLIKSVEDSPSAAKDLEKANPVDLLLDKKKDLKLSDDEQKELKNINGSIKSTIKPYLKTMDSVSRELKKEGDFAPTQGQILIGRKLSREASDSVRATYRRALQEALAKLAEERREPAMEAVKKEQADQAAARRGGKG